jgi:hypothetical protein
MQVTLKENANEAELQKAKEHSKQQGGEIKHEFSLIKGFTYAARLTFRCWFYTIYPTFFHFSLHPLLCSCTTETPLHHRETNN